MKLEDIQLSFRNALENELKRSIYNAAVIFTDWEIETIVADTIHDIYDAPADK